MRDAWFDDREMAPPDPLRIFSGTKQVMRLNINTTTNKNSFYFRFI